MTIGESTMDGRWSLYLAGGLLSGLLGCSSLQNAPPMPGPAAGSSPNRPADQVTQPQPPTPPAVPSTSLSKLTRPKTVTPPTPTPAPEIASAPRTSLKPATYVSIGSLKDQAADDPQRSEQERDAFRYQARQAYLKATQVDPKFAPAYVALAKSYFATGERDKCLAEFKKALAIAPNDA